MLEGASSSLDRARAYQYHFLVYVKNWSHWNWEAKQKVDRLHFGKMSVFFFSVLSEPKVEVKRSYGTECKHRETHFVSVKYPKSVWGSRFRCRAECLCVWHVYSFHCMKSWMRLVYIVKFNLGLLIKFSIYTRLVTVACCLLMHCINFMQHH